MDSCQKLVRCEAKYQNESGRFIMTKKDFKCQYAHLYAARLWTMKPKVQEAAKAKWGEGVPVRKLSELCSNEQCVIIGTLFKKMVLKPSILKEIGEEHNLMPQPVVTNYVDPSDQLILEDELQRITLTGNIDVNTAITGVVVAVYGCERSESPGKFIVEDIVCKAVPVQDPLPIVNDDTYIVFLSGLEIESASLDTLRLRLLVDLLVGNLGDHHTLDWMAKIARVVIAGNSLSKSTQDREHVNRAKYLTKKSTAGTKNAVSALDDILAQLCSCMDVDLMAGEFDPTTFTLPQQPLHRCMFPLATKFETMHCVTNPYEFIINGVRVLGTSGQPVQDINRFSTIEDHLKIVEKTLTTGHIAPTAPDTLGCYPYADRDPFILESCPHIYFSGNAPHFEKKLYHGAQDQKVLLLAIPKFCEAYTGVVVNLRTLDCKPLLIGDTSIF